MPDFNIEAFYHCITAERFRTEVKGSKGNYTVEFGPSQGRYEYDYTCNCQAFKFGKGKPCKHIEEVIDSGKRCGWMQVIDGGIPLEPLCDGHKVCPRCGSDVSVARHAV